MEVLLFNFERFLLILNSFFRCLVFFDQLREELKQAREQLQRIIATHQSELQRQTAAHQSELQKVNMNQVKMNLLIIIFYDFPMAAALSLIFTINNHSCRCPF